MSARSRTARRSSILLSPGGIVIGYVIILFAVTARVVAFPFSGVSIGLLCVVVGAFFVVAVPIVVMVYLFFLIAFCRAVIGLGRRILFGADQDSVSQRTGNRSVLQKDLETQGTDTGLWDRWID